MFFHKYIICMITICHKISQKFKLHAVYCLIYFCIENIIIIEQNQPLMISFRSKLYKW